MKLTCGREQDVLDAVAARRWPHRADIALRDHAAVCRICADVAEVASAFADDSEASPDPPVPSASVVWWKAQIRAREEAAQLAARPIVFVQAVATICAAIAAIALAPTASAWARELVVAAAAAGWWASPKDVGLGWILGAAAYTTVPLLAVGIWVVLAPVVVYLALDE